MSETTVNLGMPSDELLVAETIKTLTVEGYRHSFMALAPEVLSDLASQLITPGVNRSDVKTWLEGVEGAPVPNGNFYRFVSEFSRVFKQRWSEHALRAVRLAIESPSNAEQLTGYAQQQMIRLISAELAATPALSDLSASRLVAISTSVRNAQKTSIQMGEAERREKKLEADLELVRQKLSRVPEQVKAIQGRIDRLAEAIAKGDTAKIDPSIFDAIRAELVSLATPPKEAA